MSAPFIFIATNRLREGKLAAERDRAADLGSFIKANEPQLLAFNEYVNEDGTEVGVVQIHPNAASMEFHMDVLAERAVGAYAATLEATTSIQVYGEPSHAVLEMLKRQAGAGVPMTVKRQHVAGFTRLQHSLRPKRSPARHQRTHGACGGCGARAHGETRARGQVREYCFRGTTRLPPFRAADSQCAHRGSRIRGAMKSSCGGPHA